MGTPTIPSIMENYSTLLTDNNEMTEEQFQQYVSSNNYLKTLIDQSPGQVSAPDPSISFLSSMTEDGCVGMSNEVQMRTLLIYVLDKLNSLALQLKMESIENKQLKSSLCELEEKFARSRKETKEMIDDIMCPSFEYDINGAADVDDLSNAHTNMLEKVDKLELDLYNFECRLIEMEQDARKGSLVISGIPNSVSTNDIENKVMEAMAFINCPVTREHVVNVKRSERLGNNRYPGHTLVQFSNHKYVQFCLQHRDLLLDAKSTLKMNLRFYDNLCEANEEVRKMCRVLKGQGKIRDYHIKNGFVAIIVKEGDRPCRIPHIDVLKSRFSDIL